MSILRLTPSWAPGPASPSRKTPAALSSLARLTTIAGAHLVLAWALLQSHGVRQVLHEARPLVVALRSDSRPSAPQPALPLPAPARPLPAPALLPPPEISVAQTPPAPPPLPAAPAPEAPTPPALVTTSAAPVAAMPAPTPTPRPSLPPPAAAVPAEPRQVGAGQIRYRVPPAIEVPMASRRLGESGTVLLRVVVDVHGLPRQISLHKSSGHARLDEQALAAMRSARFQPLVEGGSAVEWLVIAPLQYDID